MPYHFIHTKQYVKISKCINTLAFIHKKLIENSEQKVHMIWLAMHIKCIMFKNVFGAIQRYLY